MAERRRFVTLFVDKLIQTHYPNEFAERKRQYQEEIKEIQSNENEIPIFVCTLGMPFAPCPLHVYEPRYKLMLRRAIESESRRFGMCMYSERTPYHFTEYGCMLEIRDYQFTRDGRAILNTVGGRRFKVCDSSTRDGYSVARVEWITDEKCQTEEEKLELQQLHDEVYRLAHTWYSFIPEMQKNRIHEIYGVADLPEPEPDSIQTDNGPYWHWFLLNILPLDNNIQYKFLTKTSLKERLKQMKKIILILMAPLMQMFQQQQTNQMSISSSVPNISSIPPTSTISSLNSTSVANMSQSERNLATGRSASAANPNQFDMQSVNSNDSSSNQTNNQPNNSNNLL